MCLPELRLDASMRDNTERALVSFWAAVDEAGFGDRTAKLIITIVLQCFIFVRVGEDLHIPGTTGVILKSMIDQLACETEKFVGEETLLISSALIKELVLALLC